MKTEIKLTIALIVLVVVLIAGSLAATAIENIFVARFPGVARKTGIR